MSAKNELLASRIVQIICKLNQGERLSIKELANEFSVSVRTIQRDVARLKASLISLEAINDTIWLEQSALGKLSLKDIRVFAGHVGLEAMLPHLDKKVLLPLLSDAPPFQFKQSNIENKARYKLNFDKLQRYIENKNKVCFRYKNKQYQAIEPYKLVCAKNLWYLAAVDGEKLKAFHLSEISSLLELPERFEPSPLVLKRIDEEEGIFFSSDKFEVIVKVSSRAAPYFIRRNLFPEQKLIKEHSNGELEISSLVSLDMQILPLIKYWIPEVEVISPLHIKETIFQQLKSYLGM